MSEYKVPNTFIAGTRAKASQVNANFDYLAKATTDLDQTKAEIEGNAAVNFSVAEPIDPQHAVTKRYVDQALAYADSTGSGVGKSLFEVFHTLSTKTPPGAFSLRTGELIPNASEDFPSFFIAVQQQGEGLIADFTNATADDIATKDEDSEYFGYSASFERISAASKDYELRVFSPYGWFTSNSAPTDEEPIIAVLNLPQAISCSHFRINSNVYDSYISEGTADAAKAIKTAVISVRQADGTWHPVSIINESEVPVSNSRIFANTMPNLKFDAIRIVVSANFGASATDISVYPVDPDKTAVRLITEEQWQWEVETFGETGGFVIDEEEDTLRLPKITRYLTGVNELWEIGMPSAASVSRSSLLWQEGKDPIVVESSNTQVSLNSVATGLWIQAYNAISEDALASVRYIPHAVLFEERTFRFIPDVVTGWAVSDGNWFDGEYYVDAMTEVLNAHSQAKAVSGKNYKLAPNNMRFVTNEVYMSTLATYGECPYYVVDTENYRFKTPTSNNYVRLTNDTDQMNELELDAAPNITGRFPTQETTAGFEGAFKVDTSVKSSKNDNTNGNPDYSCTFDASRSSAVYGRSSNEIRVKSSKQILCVFLGNEIPQSSAVNVFTQLKEHTKEIAELESSSSNSIKEIKTQLSKMDSVDKAQSEQIQKNEDEIAVVKVGIEDLNKGFDVTSSDIHALQDKDLAIDASLLALTARIDNLDLSSSGSGEAISNLDAAVSELEANKQDVLVAGTNITITPSADNSFATIDALDKEILAGNAVTVDTTETQVTVGVDQSVLDAKQDKLTPGSGILIEENVINISSTVATTADIDGINARLESYSLKAEVDAKLTDYASKEELEAVSDRVDNCALKSALTPLATKSELNSKFNDVSARLGGLSLVKMTQAEYDALEPKDANTLYVIVG